MRACLPIFTVSCILCAAWLLAPNAGAEDRMDRMTRIARDISGRFEDRQSVGWATVLFVVRQEGNKFPHMWAGRWGGGDLVLRANYDPLDDDIVIRGPGSFTLEVAAVASRRGLEDLIPLQTMVADLRNQPVAIRFQGFQEWQLMSEEEQAQYRRRKQTGAMSKARCTAVVVWGDKEFPFPGQTVRFVHDGENSSLILNADVVVDGKVLGMPESQHGPISIGIRVTSPPPQVLMDEVDSASDLLGF